MLRLMIVDDEKTTRESLERYVPWGALGVGHVQIARNGVEALTLAARTPPDILLTDVRMPRLDGLELAQRLRESHPGCRVVFLSGYADKEYLKTAIRLQAVGYIEKPIDIEEVTKVVRQAIAAWEEEAMARREDQRMRKALQDDACLVREQIVRRLVNGCANLEELRSVFVGALPAFEPQTSFTAAAAALRWTHPRMEGERAGLRHGLLIACGDLSACRDAPSFVGFIEPDLMAIVLARRMSKGQPPSQALYEELIESMRALSGGSVTATLAVGPTVSGWQNIPASYAMARAATSLSFYRCDDSLLFADERRHASYAVDPEDLAQIRVCLREGDIDQARAILAGIVDTVKRAEPTDIDSVREAFFQLHQAIAEIAPAHDEVSPFKPRERTYVWQEIHDRPRLDEVAALIDELIIHSFPGATECATYPRRIVEIQRYVRSGYADPNLTLRSIAERAGLSRTYLSALFKTATGKNLNEYITDIRMERAKQMLRLGMLRTNEVAARVGYQDANYFSAVFKRHVGSTPTGYRDSSSQAST